MENKKVFIGNLDFAVTDDEVRQLLSTCGEVTAVKMRAKKGYAIVEMAQAAQAEEVIRTLNGTPLRERELRISEALKPGKAKSATVKKYRERGDEFARSKADRETEGDFQKPYHRDEAPGGARRRTRSANAGRTRPKAKGGFRAAQGSGGFRKRPVDSYIKDAPVDQYDDTDEQPEVMPYDNPRHADKVWSGEKPVHIMRPARKDESGGLYKQPGEKSFNKKSGKRLSGQGNRPAGKHSSRRPAPGGDAHKIWDPDKPAYPRDGDRAVRGGSRRSESPYGSREGSSGPGKRSSGGYAKGGHGSGRPPKREWSPGNTGGRSERSGTGWNEKPRSAKPSHDGPRSHSKPRPAGGSGSRFSKSSGPKPGGHGKKRPSGPSRSKHNDRGGNR